MSLISQKDLSSAVLYKLFEDAQERDEYLTSESVAALFTSNVSLKRISLALESLKATELVNQQGGYYKYTINNKGYSYVEQALTEPNSFYAQYRKLGDDWLYANPLPTGGVPASDRVVTRSHNQPVMIEVDADLETLEQALVRDNELGAALGDERDLIKSEIQAAKVLSSAPTFRLGRLLAVIIPALRYLADKFAGGAIGETAKRLTELLIGLA